MLNTLNINLKTDIKNDRPTALGIKLMSQDKNNNQFILRFTNGGEPVTLDDTYSVEVLTKFQNSGASRLTSATVRQDYATWQFDTEYITQDEMVYNYVYVRKAGSLVVSADANAFYFDVGLSEIDKGAGRVAEVYDENYEKILADYSGALDERTTERLDEAVLDFNQRGDAEISDWREYADVELEDYLADRVGLENLVVNGDFSDGTTGWIGTFGVSTVDLSVANKILSAPIINNSLMGGVRQNTDATYNAGDKIYQKVRYRVTNDDCLTIRFSNGGTVSGGATDIVNDSVSENVWYEQSHLHTLGTGSGYLFLQILHYYADIATAKNKVLETDYIMSINLTQTFGAGNEPSKEWMDRLVEQTGYFDEYILDENWQVGEMVRLNDTKASKTQEKWITPTLINGWENFNISRFPPMSFYKSEIGKVELQGLVTGGASGTVALILPVGYRPPKVLHLQAIQTNGVSTYITISPNGNVSIFFTGTPTYVSLTGISFRAEV